MVRYTLMSLFLVENFIPAHAENILLNRGCASSR
jgi:hypothetical protein